MSVRVCYVVTWRWNEGYGSGLDDGSGAVSVHWSKDSADLIANILRTHSGIKSFAVEPVPVEPLP